MAKQQNPSSPKIGITSSEQPDLVAPSGVNERDHGAADDKPMAGGTLNFDDDEIYSGRGNNARQGGTWAADGGDSGKLGKPSGQLSSSNGPSDPQRNSPGRAPSGQAPARTPNADMQADDAGTPASKPSRDA